jgi:hypothetical protein
MRAILKHHSQGQDVANISKEFLDELKTEHAEYYGKPHGCRPGCGYVNAETAADILIGAIRLARFRNLRGKDDSPFTFRVPQKFEHVGGWQTSAGNLTIIGIEPANNIDGTIRVWEYRDGRRHGLRQCLAADEKGCDFVYLKTKRADISPDETTTAGKQNHDH